MQDRTETSRAVGKENIAKFQKSAIWPSLTQSPCKMLPRAQLRTKHGRRGALFPIAPGALCRDSARALQGLLAKRREYFRKTGASIAERLAKLLRPARGAPLSIEQDTAGEDLANSCVERQKLMTDRHYHLHVTVRSLLRQAVPAALPPRKLPEAASPAQMWGRSQQSCTRCCQEATARQSNLCRRMRQQAVDVTWL